MLEYFCPHGIVLHSHSIPVKGFYESALVLGRGLLILRDFCSCFAKLAEELHRVLRVVGVVSLVLTEYETYVLATFESRLQNIVVNSLAQQIGRASCRERVSIDV